jgi:hypothetical protein
MNYMDEPAKEDQLLHIAQSGHWNMDVEQFINAIHYYFFMFTLHGLNVDVLQYTEASTRKFRRRLKRYCKAAGLNLHHPRGRGRGECLTITRQGLPIVRRRSHARLASELRLKYGRVAPTYLLTTWVKGWGRFRFIHTPAHNRGLMAHLWQTKVWRAVMGGVRRVMRGNKSKDTFGGDMNVGLDRDLMQETIDQYIPDDMHYCGSDYQKPDIGGRLITGIWTNLLIVHRSVTLPKRPGHDHGGIATILGRVPHRA